MLKECCIFILKECCIFMLKGKCESFLLYSIGQVTIVADVGRKKCTVFLLLCKMRGSKLFQVQTVKFNNFVI